MIIPNYFGCDSDKQGTEGTAISECTQSGTSTTRIHASLRNQGVSDAVIVTYHATLYVDMLLSSD